MFRRMKWIIVLCGIGATVLITAFTLDDCDPGDQPPAPNSRTASEDTACGQEITRLRSAIADRDRLEAELKRGDDTCLLPRVWSCDAGDCACIVPVDREARAEIERERGRNDSHDAVHIFERLVRGVPVMLVDAEQVRRHLRFEISVLAPEDRAQFLMVYPIIQDCVEAMTRVIMSMSPTERARAFAIGLHERLPTHMMDWLERRVSTELTYAETIRAVLNQELRSVTPEYIMTLQLECGFDEQSIVPIVGPRTTACLYNLALRIALKRSSVPCMGLTGPAACEGIADPRWNDTPHEVGWYGTVPRGTIREEN